MHIELLWLIPILAFALTVFFVVLYLQKKTGGADSSEVLHREVELFNSGQSQQRLATSQSAAERLREMEKIINFVAEAVAGERRQVPGAQGEDSVTANEAAELREKLRSVFKEYDIILSENYTLRAKVKQLAGRIKELEIGGTVAPSFDAIPRESASVKKPAMRLYDDTRLISLASMDSDDLSESDDAVAR
ncbi:MAG: hypothetical protein JW699_00745 [Chitinispirillaceae bacterium]|nr:hypothetical protein [Chitinispirillaceae bacterium]